MNITNTELKTHEDLEKFIKLEDEIWALKAIEAEKNGYIDNALEKLNQLAKEKDV